jgi:hypothetical protein
MSHILYALSRAHLWSLTANKSVLNDGGLIAASSSGNFDATSAYLCAARGSTLAIPRVVRRLQAVRQGGLSWTSTARERCEVYYLQVAPADGQVAWLQLYLKGCSDRVVSLQSRDFCRNHMR